MPSRRSIALTLVAAALTLSACGSTDEWRRAHMGQHLSEDRPRIIELRVIGPRATIAVPESTLHDLRNVRGVLEAKRGRGRNVALVLLGRAFDPYSLTTSLSSGYRVHILSVDDGEFDGP